MKLSLEILMKLLTIFTLCWFIYLHVNQQNKIGELTNVPKRIQTTFLVINSLGITGVIIILIIVATL